MDNLFNIFDVFLLVFARMGGMIFTNPLLSRRNIPTYARIGFVLTLSLLLAPIVNGDAVASFQELDMIAALCREVLFGICFGLVFQIFFYMLFLAGDMMDTVFGLSMAKIFDPINGLQVSIMGQFLQIMFVLYFFATDSHYILVKIFAYSFEMIPPGTFHLEIAQLSEFVLSLFQEAFLLMIRLSLPFIGAEFAVEIAMGILMKLIPQIHVFVINMQCKILLGILLVMLLAQPVGNFIDYYIRALLENLQQILVLSV